MDDLKEHSCFKKAKSFTQKRVIVLFLILGLFIIGADLYIYRIFIPTALQPVQHLPELYDLHSFAFETIFALLVAWSISFFGLLGAIIYYFWVIGRLLKLIERQNSQTHELKT